MNCGYWRSFKAALAGGIQAEVIHLIYKVPHYFFFCVAKLNLSTPPTPAIYTQTDHITPPPTLDITVNIHFLQ